MFSYNKYETGSVSVETALSSFMIFMVLFCCIIIFIRLSNVALLNVGIVDFYEDVFLLAESEKSDKGKVSMLFADKIKTVLISSNSSLVTVTSISYCEYDALVCRETYSINSTVMIKVEYVIVFSDGIKLLENINGTVIAYL